MSTFTVTNTATASAAIFQDSFLGYGVLGPNTYVCIRHQVTGYDRATERFNPLALHLDHDGILQDGVIQVWGALRLVAPRAWTSVSNPHHHPLTLLAEVPAVLGAEATNITLSPVANAVLENANNNGLFDLALLAVGDPFPLVFAVGNSTLTGTTYSNFTGIVGKVHAEGRADICPRCGGRSTRDTWVKDGVTKMLLCPRCQDPPDYFTLWRNRTRERDRAGDS